MFYFHRSPLAVGTPVPTDIHPQTLSFFHITQQVAAADFNQSPQRTTMSGCKGKVLVHVGTILKEADSESLSWQKEFEQE